MSDEGLMEKAVSMGQIEGLSFEEIAKNYDTPCYVYSADAIHRACKSCIKATSGLDARLRYAIKANSNLSLLRELLEYDFGFDASSRLEIARALRAGADVNDILFTGPGKRTADITHALRKAVDEIICESEGELDLVASIAKQINVGIKVGVRVNLDVDANTHPHITTGLADSKFGVPVDKVHALFQKIDQSDYLEPGSLHCHIGSQISELGPYVEAAQKMLELRGSLVSSGIEPTCVDLGGGFSVGEFNNRPKTDVFAELCDWLKENAKGIRVGFQPGRLLMARAGILLARVLYTKGNNTIIDAAMTELIRPGLYGAVHGIAHVGGHPAGPGDINVVGPVCENADYLVRGVDLNAKPGDLVAIFDAGAYAREMSSEYNGRLKPCEVLIEDGVDVLIRTRQSIDDAMRNEIGLGTTPIG